MIMAVRIPYRGTIRLPSLSDVGDVFGGSIIEAE
jgi:hypothetical protein